MPPVLPVLTVSSTYCLGEPDKIVGEPHIELDNSLNEIRHMGTGFRCLVYYGPGRQAPRSKLERCDAVITTYNVVASEWKNCKRPGKVPTHDLFSLKWHRLVLDEGEPCSFRMYRRLNVFQPT
jgi:SNF2 family DNA or RNA helicase